MIAAHSNQARITAFPRNDTDNCLYSHDVISLAKEIGLYQSKPNDPHDLEFSFSDVYNPVTFMGARASDARTWSIFSIIAKDESFQQTFQDYALGKNLTNRMPLYIEPHSKLTFGNIMSVMSNHYEDTALQFDQDVGAGPYKSPYRARPLKWSYKGTSYHNERAVATQQTGWNFIAQIRMNKPAPISSILWFAVDDSSTSPRFPVYGCSRNVSFAYAGDGTQMGVPSPLLSFDLQKAFWVQNMVSNFVYTRWDDAFPFLQKKLASIHEHFKQEVEIIDKELMAVYDPNDFSWIINDATAFSVKAGDWMHREWMDFYGHIFARYRDFSVIEEDKEDPVCNCKVNENGFTDAWKEKVIQESGKHYQCLDDDNTPDQASVDHSTSEAVKVGESSLRGGQFSISGDAKSKN
jgi:dipeptidase